jgi:putative PIN family toxin of toxin-antitoxin system
MKLVLDTNVFISAFYWGGNSQKVIDRIIVGLDELYVSNKILEEISQVMGRPKFKTEQETIDKYLETIEKNCKKVFTEGKIKGICRDKDDDDKLECGIICDADYIITGDDDLLVLENYKTVKIITPMKYLAMINSTTFV